MIIGGRSFTCGTHVMTIINLTPDSFYSPSRRMAEDVLPAVEEAIKSGAAVIDIGAQSTRPGYKEIDADEEISRFLKPLKMIKKRFSVPVSVDTYYEKSARAALDEGADMINDVWGLTYSPGIAKTIARYDASVCIMHNAHKLLCGDIWEPIKSFLSNSVRKALDAGVHPDKICLDGGIGFAKTGKQNHELLNGYDRLSSLGFPLLLGASRKSMFGGEAKDRLEATLNSTRLAVKMGVLFVRVHDTAENVDAIKKEQERIKRTSGSI